MNKTSDESAIFQALDAILEAMSDEYLLDDIFTYSRENIALVNIYIKPPVVTRILRDQRSPIIWYALRIHFTNINQMTNKALP